MAPFVIYSRKSLEDDDKQIQSIPAQEEEMSSFAAKLGLPVRKPFFSESKSAKAPGRPVFNELMQKVEQGEIKGILCWKLDRLARNPVDGGRIIWAVKQYGLIIRTPQQSFSRAEDNLILMYIEFGIAQKYVDDLVRNTKRGLEAKAKGGWLPSQAPTGYLNSKIEERGQKTIYPDPDRFDAVRRMWDLMLTGKYTPAMIRKFAKEELGFRTRQTKKTGGQPLSRSGLYAIFANRFYCGQYEYPKGSGQWYQGRHAPMITEAEFDHVQYLLHRGPTPRPQKDFDFPFRGLFKCGECGSGITAHVKEQVRCTRCRYKSSVKNVDACGKCGLSTTEMTNPVRRQYVYYHCTRKLSARCRQKCLSASELEQQLELRLQHFGLPAELRDWGMQYIDRLRAKDLTKVAQIGMERRKSLDQCVQRIANLVKLKTAPENADNSLLSDEEYQRLRTDLLSQKASLEKSAGVIEAEINGKARIAKEALKTLNKFGARSEKSRASRQRHVLSALGLNHLLIDKKLEIRPDFPFSELPLEGCLGSGQITPIEPENTQENAGSFGRFGTVSPFPERDADDVRTKLLEVALKKIWRESKGWQPIIERGTLMQEPPSLKNVPRKRGRFISRRHLDSS